MPTKLNLNVLHTQSSRRATKRPPQSDTKDAKKLRKLPLPNINMITVFPSQLLTTRQPSSHTRTCRWTRIFSSSLCCRSRYSSGVLGLRASRNTLAWPLFFSCHSYIRLGIIQFNLHRPHHTAWRDKPTWPPFVLSYFGRSYIAHPTVEETKNGAVTSDMIGDTISDLESQRCRLAVSCFVLSGPL